MRDRVERVLAELDPDGMTKRQRSGLVLPALQRVQREFGYLPEEVIPEVADFLGVTESHVYGVATFYSHFRFAPAARNDVTVCRGTACHVRGSARLLDQLSKRLGIGVGESTPDLGFHLDTIACFGSSALAPVVVINGKVRGRMNRTRLMKSVEQLAADNEKEKSASQEVQL